MSQFWFEGADKLAHGGMYAVMAFLLMHGIWKSTGGTARRNVILAGVLTVLLGVILEWIQHTMRQGRHFEVMDIIANISGTFIGCAAYLIFRKQ